MNPLQIVGNLGPNSTAQDNTKKIFENPLKAQKVVNTQQLNNTIR